MLIVLGLLVFMIVFIKVCSVHTPSSNPRKPPALKFSETLRRPMKRVTSSDFFFSTLFFSLSFVGRLNLCSVLVNAGPRARTVVTT